MAMGATFANLTRADFGGRWNTETHAVKRSRVHVLFDEIQVAIHNRNSRRLTVSWRSSPLRPSRHVGRVDLAM
jgi:hypothetical protein